MSQFGQFIAYLKDHEVTQQTMRATPAVGGAAYSWLTVNNAVAFVTGIYVVIQAAYLLRKWYREEKDWRGRKRRS